MTVDPLLLAAAKSSLKNLGTSFKQNLVRKIFKRKCESEHSQQFSFKYFVKVFLVKQIFIDS